MRKSGTEKFIFKNPNAYGVSVNYFFYHIFSFRIRCLSAVFFFVCILCSEVPAQKNPMQKQTSLEIRISEVARHYIGIPYKFGSDPNEVGAADNSHLLCSIYEQAAEQAGLRFAGYMPMRILMRNIVAVRQDYIRNGDLMVLNDGHAAMIYNVESPENFDLIYASLKRQEVTSFNSRNVVFEAYWLKNLRGYYRVSEQLFSRRD